MGYGSSGKGESFRRAVGEELVTCRKEVVELLLVNGSKVNATAFSGKTALDYASRAGHNKTADLLRQHGGKTRAELKAE